MKLEPESLNIKFPPPVFTWRSQRFLILMCAGLSLLAVMPSSLVLAVCTVLIGTPLFWLIFGSKLVFRHATGMPIFRFFVIFTLVYLVAKLLTWAVPEFGNLLASYGIA
jgi:hypothetical protein